MVWGHDAQIRFLTVQLLLLLLSLLFGSDIHLILQFLGFKRFSENSIRILGMIKIMMMLLIVVFEKSVVGISAGMKVIVILLSCLRLLSLM